LTAFGFGSVEQLSEFTVVAMGVLAAPLVDGPTPSALSTVEKLLADATIRASNVAVIGELTDSSTPETTGSGSSAANVLTDLNNVTALIPFSGGSRLVVFASPTRIKNVALKATTAGEQAFPSMSVSGGDIGGIQLIPADGMSEDFALAMDLTQIAANADPLLTQASRDASIHMNSVPASPNDHVSMFQTDAVALRTERLAGIALANPDAVAIIERVAW
jgi:hypothetical protein